MPSCSRSPRRILTERGEDHSRRASNASDYLLSGLVTCARCGHHFTGTVAHGRSSSYRYYTCFSRQRYGTKACDADRLPADALDAAVLDALLKTYGRTDLFDRAVKAAGPRQGRAGPPRRRAGRRGGQDRQDGGVDRAVPTGL